MAWPVDDLTTTHLDASADDPDLARVEILAAVEKLQEVLAQTITDYALTLMAADSDAAARSTLALGTAATANIGTSGATVGLLNAQKTDSGNNTYLGNHALYGDTLKLYHHSASNVDTDVFGVFDDTANMVGAFHVSGMNGAGAGSLSFRIFDGYSFEAPAVFSSHVNALGNVTGAGVFVNGIPVAGVWTYSSPTTVTYPVGTEVVCYDSGAIGYARNAVVPVKYATANTFFFTTGAGTLLTGTWRARGYLYTNSPTNTENYVLCQRVS